MAIVSLNQQERDRFVAWLLQEADSNELLVSHMSGSAPMEMLAKVKRAEIAACRVVAEILSSTESMSIGGHSSTGASDET